MPFGLTFFRTRRQIILKHSDLRILRRIAAFLLVVLSIAGIAACTVPEEVFLPDTPTAAISDVLHTTEPTEIGTAAEIELSAKPTAPPQEPTSSPVKESGEYSSRDEVALYIHLFGHLPANFITKKQARELGWQGGGLQDFAPGCSIGGAGSATTRGFCRKREEGFIPNAISTPAEHPHAGQNA